MLFFTVCPQINSNDPYITSKAYYFCNYNELTIWFIRLLDNFGTAYALLTIIRYETKMKNTTNNLTNGTLIKTKLFLSALLMLATNALIAGEAKVAYIDSVQKWDRKGTDLNPGDVAPSRPPTQA